MVKKTPIILFKQSVYYLLTISFLQYDFGNNLHTVTWICNFSTWEVEAEESGVRGHSWIPREFETSLGYK